MCKHVYWLTERAVGDYIDLHLLFMNSSHVDEVRAVLSDGVVLSADFRIGRRLSD
jgi:hypothetical protein